ncbi:hypothetical protein GIB67_022141 [Kingdonia uniflora]|uniref:Putative zinc-finger domain-containing protein n=1 Tax=Kingdonia uniflora TaxID=39325 RepID=A0A7J7N8W5_9MAGN|nr:hypothetical protein GIB67_022141 [Kingdonia uniflora]
MPFLEEEIASKNVEIASKNVEIGKLEGMIVGLRGYIVRLRLEIYCLTGSIIYVLLSLAGKCISIHGPVDIRPTTSVSQSYNKHFGMNPVQFKPGNHYNHSWYMPFVPSSDFLISFSDDDDDSGSDSAEHIEPDKLHQIAHYQMKLMPKKVAVSRPLVSPMTKVHGISSRGSGADQVFPALNLDPFNKCSAIQEDDINQAVNLNNSKRESLLQEIAARENRINVQSNKKASGLLHDCNDRDLNKNINKTCRPVRTAQSDPIEPDRKRPRGNEPNQGKLDSESRQKILIPSNSSISKLKMPLAETVSPSDRDFMSCSQYTPVGTTDTTPVFSGNILSGGKNGPSFESLLEIIPFSLQKPDLPNKQGGRSLSDAVLLDPSTELNESFGADDGAACKLKMPSTKKPAFPINTGLLNRSDLLNLSNYNKIDTETLMKIEELQDKELEETQEHRRRCEVEERNAMIIYREAQLALVDANAKCTHLYRKREMFSARFRALMMEDAGSFWSSRWNKQTENEIGSLNMDPEPYEIMLPTKSHQLYTRGCNLVADSTIQHATGVVTLEPAYSTLGLLHHEGNNMIHQLETSERTLVADSNVQHTSNAVMLEHVASTLKLMQHKDNNTLSRVSTDSSHTNTYSHNSVGEDEPFGNEAVQSICQNEDFNNRKVDSFDGSRKNKSFDGTQDLALLEESLRSKLFAQLGKKNELKIPVPCFSGESGVDKGVGSLTGNERHLIDMVNQSYEEAEGMHVSNVQGIDRTIGSSLCQPSINVDNHFHEVRFPDEESGSSETCKPFVSDSSLPSSVLNTVFRLVVVTAPISFGGLSFKTTTQEEEDNDVGLSEHGLGVLRSSLTENSVRGVNIGEIGCYACYDSIDPLWPVCMFELRGKCNDDECLLQHIKDYPERNTKRHNHSANTDSQVGPSQLDKFFGCGNKLSQHLPRHNLLTFLTYPVGFNLLKADLHASGSLLASRNLHSVVQFLSIGDDAHFGGQMGWNRRSLYFQNQDGKMFRHSLADPEQALDLALVVLSGEINKVEGKKKVALSLLSRALEFNPTSVALWVVYLHVYQKSEMANGKDDMLSQAINNYEGSYELWLMYINSRVKLEDCLLAYERALSALCRQAFADHDRDKMHFSACILDLLLQMMNCFCMSGGINKFVQRIYELLDHRTKFLTNILTCFTVSDRCIFWVCCVYLFIYRKLPDAVVHQFESEKAPLFNIEWPSVKLTDGKKLRVMELLEMAVKSVALSTNGGTNQIESAHGMASMFAISHVKCIAVFEDVKCGKLLEKYIRLYPTSLELVLISARLHKIYFGDLSFEGFEAALRNWPREIPGIQSIWNQYAQCALENEGIDFTKQLMDRWFHSDPRNHCLYSKTSDDSDGGNFVACEPMDLMFALLNFSLYKLMQKDTVEACLAIEKALTVAPVEEFRHCVREHAVFSLSDFSDQMEDANGSRVLSLLNSYLVDARALPVSDLLSRKFCQNVRKPRNRQLINNILGPISSDYSLLNLVLEAWYGPSLLPERFVELKDMVDFVEALMDYFPSNYQLAMSVCKFITKYSNSSSTFAPASVVFWTSSLLVNSICEAVPVAPEHSWVEVATVLCDLVEAQDIPEMFYQRGLSVYPFSMKLWKSYHKISKITGNTNMVIKAAIERGIKLD